MALRSPDMSSKDIHYIIPDQASHAILVQNATA